jgi:hypothetical protein
MVKYEVEFRHMGGRERYVGVAICVRTSDRVFQKRGDKNWSVDFEAIIGYQEYYGVSRMALGHHSPTIWFGTTNPTWTSA